MVVNEVSASNRGHLPDNFGSFEDYIELYNTTAAPVDLSGWYLSDSQNNNTKFQFPAGAGIAANGHLVVFCSGRNVSIGNVHHTGFKLNQTQEERAVLSTPDGTIVSNFKLEERTQLDHSWGRTTDGANTWSLFRTPTPGASNANPSAYYAAEPFFDVPAGFHPGPIQVGLSTVQPASSIRYTLDGSEPTAASTLYTAPIAINATTVLKAATFPNDPAIPPSFTGTRTYFIGVQHTVKVLSVSGGQLPVLFGGTQIEPFGYMEFFGEDGALKGTSAGEFNKHGNDSWAYAQRGVDFVARDELGQNDGMAFQVFRTKNREHFQRLILKAAASDNYPFENGGAHIRDAFVQALSHEGDLRLDERTYEPCVLYVNGQYWGVYEIREKVDDHDFTAYYYDQGEYDLQYLKTWGNTWEEYGMGTALNDWNALRAYIQGNDMGDPSAFANVETQLNWKSLVDYFVLNSYIVSQDWLNWNTGWWRGLNPAGDGRRWRYTLWDMDACFGHYNNFTGIPDPSPNADPCNAEDLPNPGGQGHTEILTKLVQENATVRNWYVSRYIDLGNTVFSCDHMIPFLDSLVNLIAPEMPQHVARWGGSVAGWEANVQDIRDFILARCTAIQEGMVDCYDLNGPYPVTFQVDPPGSGRIRINSTTSDTYPFQGLYYGGIPVEMAPLPNTDWTFSHWEIFGANQLLPSTLDSLVTLELVEGDSVVAHFVPPTRHPVVLDMVPRTGGAIRFGNDVHSTFPTTVEVPEGVSMPFEVLPTEFHTFLRWEIVHALATPPEEDAPSRSAVFMMPDTVVAWLEPMEHTFHLPNAFSPNGDGFNDVFHVVGQAIGGEGFELLVMDRWGRPVFRTERVEEGWDGQWSGSPAPGGVYVYQLRITDGISGARQQRVGHVTLVR